MGDLEGLLGHRKAEKKETQKTFKNIRKTNVFEGFQGNGESQVGPKMAPSWAKMGLGSELKLILGHLRGKMAIKVELC